MPWILQPFKEPYSSDPESCPNCGGNPASGEPQCQVCGAAFIADDPPPGFVDIITIIPSDENGDPLPRNHRKDIEIRWGERVQNDGSIAQIYRSINKQADRYVEKTVRSDGEVLKADEPLSEHRGHGSQKKKRTTESIPRSDPSVQSQD